MTNKVYLEDTYQLHSEGLISQAGEDKNGRPSSRVVLLKGLMKKVINYFLILSCIVIIPNSYAEKTNVDYENEIRSKSAEWNKVFVTRDMKPFLPLLAPDVQMTSAGGKWQTPDGTEKFFRSLFKQRPDITWVNEPKNITTNPLWNVAYEMGDWTESWTEPDGNATIKGKYSALWKLNNEAWSLHAMIFIPLSCTGPSKYCLSQKEKTIQFEKEIAYFYGAKNPEIIAQYYIQALKGLEKLGIQANETTLKKEMLDPLLKAYEEVKVQTERNFDPKKAAKYEFQLILAQAKGDTFETIYQIMTNLYNEVFGSHPQAIQKAAMLRTFLYIYKISLQKNNTLSIEDQNLLRAMAKSSEQILNNIK